MQGFQYNGGALSCDGIALTDIAREFGTPTYVYSSALLHTTAQRALAAFEGAPSTLCYAVKANGNLSLLKRIFALGFGADVVSVGEPGTRASRRGRSEKDWFFSGIVKQRSDIERAIRAGIRAINVESSDELLLIRDTARALHKRAPVCLRLNPDIDAKTIPQITTGLYDTKFGIAEGELPHLLSVFEKGKIAWLWSASPAISEARSRNSPRSRRRLPAWPEWRWN